MSEHETQGPSRKINIYRGNSGALPAVFHSLTISCSQKLSSDPAARTTGETEELVVPLVLVNSAEKLT
jgi:hypothetical protein